MKAQHPIPKYFKDPEHPITVHVAGAGGSGSQVLANLARINASLYGLGHAGLQVTAFDPDKVSEANFGRQLFSPSDIGMYKAQILVSRINRFYGFGWDFISSEYKNIGYGRPNILITCVDTAKARLDIIKSFQKTADGYASHEKAYYWLDLGNLQDSGQAVLGSVFKTEVPLPKITDMFDLSQVDEEDQGPSCSLAEALGKQDLFINSVVSQFACDLIWKLFRSDNIDVHGFYVNLKSFKVNPIRIEI